ncbi:MAG: zinc-ribbon domain-containing protein [Tissierellia bacterium]|nr:zinc-ribbon domain-containing protein [Tissierellia bacterium]
MIFLASYTTEEKDIPLDQDLVIHDSCGQYGRYQPFYMANTLRLFFIPLGRFNKRFFVRMTCCGEIYGLKEEVGLALLRGKKSSIRPQDLVDINNYAGSGLKKCPSCGILVESADFYCKNCGQRL